MYMNIGRFYMTLVEFIINFFYSDNVKYPKQNFIKMIDNRVNNFETCKKKNKG